MFINLAEFIINMNTLFIILELQINFCLYF